MVTWRMEPEQDIHLLRAENPVDRMREEQAAREWNHRHDWWTPVGQWALWLLGCLAIWGALAWAGVI